MGKGLKEYAAERMSEYQPAPEPGRADTVRTAATREEVAAMLPRMLDQIRRGQEPQATLCTAIHVIGLLTSDTEWEAACLQEIDNIYSGTAQLSLLEDQTVIEAEERQERRAQFAEKTRKRFEADIRECGRLIGTLQEGIRILENMKP